MTALLPILLQAAPMLIDFISKNKGPLQDFFGGLTGGQANPLSALFGVLGGQGAASPEIVTQLKRIADALESLVASKAVPHPVG